VREPVALDEPGACVPCPRRRPRSMTFITCPPPGASAPATAIADAGAFAMVPRTRCARSLLEEPVVVPHLQLALELAHRLERDAHHDEDRRAAEGLHERSPVCWNRICA